MKRLLPLLALLPLLTVACNEDPPANRDLDTGAALDMGFLDGGADAADGAADAPGDTGPIVECTEDGDCESGYCDDNGSCREPACDDGVQNQDETDVDCGGSVSGCEPCEVDGSCEEADDCASRVCEQGQCAAPDCEDGVQNGSETDVDCGGASCEGCQTQKGCQMNGDCASGVCDENTCVAAACTDGVQNGQETAVDCGGPECNGCAPMQACSEADDCTSGVCENGQCAAPTCEDGISNGQESGTDCGGPTCESCESGEGCEDGEDCKSGVCATGGGMNGSGGMSGMGGMGGGNGQKTCQPAACDDGIKNGSETDVDCGGVGSACAACDPGANCSGKDDCASGVCKGGACAAPSCSDGVKNGRETAVDCGGPASGCNACPAGQSCGMDGDCASNICQMGTCAAASCTDGAKNSGESDVDCGGPACNACPVGNSCDDGGDCTSQVCKSGQCAQPTCNDGKQNGQESDVDCGGPTCGGCNIGGSCNVGDDCSSKVCKSGLCKKPTCTDGQTNGRETDTDCGGPDCGTCSSGAACGVDRDCASQICKNGQCAAPTCGDGVQNGKESDTDCGGAGSGCPGCPDGGACGKDGDCQSGVCKNNQCAAATCSDGVKNGNETDVDCGGANSGCTACSDGKACKAAGDCTSGVCQMTVCQAPDCNDKVQNGQETDVDCGGPSCGGCSAGGQCANDGDCTSGVCTMNQCQAPTCSDGVQNGRETDVDCGGGNSGCSGCGFGGSCQGASDCSTAKCINNTCVECKDGNTRPTQNSCGYQSRGTWQQVCNSGKWSNSSCQGVWFGSCKEVEAAKPNASDGVYTIDPGGPGGPSSFKAYCDLTRGGGGWTLIGRAKGTDKSFSPVSDRWTDGQLINTNTATSVGATSSMKNQGWLRVKNDSIRVCWGSPTTRCANFTHNKSATTQSVFKTPKPIKVAEQWDFPKLKRAWGRSKPYENRDYEWCGLNFANSPDHSTNIIDINTMNDGTTGTAARLGCIGDQSSDITGGPDDYALGIGVSSCRDAGGCQNVTNSDNLHYRVINHSDGTYNDTVYIFVK